MALFSCYIEEYIVDFVSFSGALGTLSVVTFVPFGYAPEGHGSPPPVNSYMCIPIEFKDDICTDYFQEVHVNYPLHWQIISQIQTKRSGVGVEAV